jgi:hypothetical protein
MKALTKKLVLALVVLFSQTQCNNISDFQQVVERENKQFQIGLSSDMQDVEDGFYPIRMDIRFSQADDYKKLFEPKNFNYIMNDIGVDFKFLDGKDTISPSGNFATFNNATQSVSVVCLFPKEIKKADHWILKNNCFLTKNLIQKI